MNENEQRKVWNDLFDNSVRFQRISKGQGFHFLENDIKIENDSDSAIWAITIKEDDIPGLISP